MSRSEDLRDLEDDLESARRRREQLWRSKIDGRMVNEPEVDQSIRRLDVRIRDMEREAFACNPCECGGNPDCEDCA